METAHRACDCAARGYVTLQPPQARFGTGPDPNTMTGPALRRAPSGTRTKHSNRRPLICPSLVTIAAGSQ